MAAERQREGRRFGPYQAVEELAGNGEAELWHAWDPYLGRYVIVAALGAADAASLERDLADLDAALRRWTGIGAFRAADVLHFFPGDGAIDPYVVLAPGGALRAAGTAAPTEAAPPGAVPVATAWRSDAMVWQALTAAALLIAGLVLLFLWFGRDRPPPPLPLLPVATPTPWYDVEAAVPWDEPTATQTPTPTETPVPAARRPAAARPAAPPTPTRSAVEPRRSEPEPVRPPAAAERGAVAGEVTARTQRLVGPDVLVREWLLGHCREVEEFHREEGRQVACGWMGVAIDGELPEIVVSFTQIDRHLPQERDLFTALRVRLLCTDHCVVLAREATQAEVY